MSKIKVKDYGDILAVKCNGEKIYYSTEGSSYRGEYVAVVKAQKEIKHGGEKLDQYYVFIGSYGACSGCDWLEAEQDWDTGEVDVKSALEYAEQSNPLYILARKPTKVWVDKLAKKVNS